VQKPSAAAGAPPPLPNVIHFAIVLVGALASLFVLRYDPEAALGIAEGTATYTLLLALYRGYRITGDGLNVFTLSMMVMLLLYPLHGMLTHDSPVAMRLLGSDRYEYFTYGLLVMVPGTWLMYLGFRGGKPGPFARFIERRSRPIDDTSPALSKKLAVLVVIGLTARVLLVLTGTGTYVNLRGNQATGSSFTFLLDVFGNTTLIVALYLFATGAKHKLWPRTAIGVAMILMESIWGGFFSGSRYLFFVPLLSAVGVYSAAVKRISLGRMSAILVVFVMIALPLATAYKNAYLSRIVELQRQGLSATTVLDSLESAEFGQGREWTDLVGERFHSLTSLALVIRYTPERHPYMWGKPYLLLPLDIAVPRVIWPDKPFIRQFANDFRFDYFKVDRGSLSAVKTSQFGELWANLHLFGVLLGAWVWGRILRFMYSFQFLGGRESLFGRAIYAAALPTLVSVIETDQVTGMAFLAKSFIVWMAWTWFLGRKTSPTASAPPRRRPLTDKAPEALG